MITTHEQHKNEFWNSALNIWNEPRPLRTGLVYQELLKIIFWIRDVKTDGLFDWIYFAILDQVNLDALRYSGNVQQKSRLTNPNTEPHWKKPAWYQRRQTDSHFYHLWDGIVFAGSHCVVRTLMGGKERYPLQRCNIKVYLARQSNLHGVLQGCQT